MEDKYIDNHRFRLCVEEARKQILEKDDLSLEARSLLANLIYHYTNIEGINFQKLTWKTIKVNNSDWLEHFDITENRFENIKEFLIEKFT